MGVVAQKIPGRQAGAVERLVRICQKFVRGFMDFADVGFRYIDIPGDEEHKRPKKKKKMIDDALQLEFLPLIPGLAFQH
ncbi:MAG: hypothetical protein K6T29_03590 [Peptococcaceae bacterium]|nr:hypothetical protein [Peptococcaceae bacterium]